MTASAQQSSSTTYVVTGEGRASYAHVFTPRLNDLSGKTEYSMAFLIPKTDKATLAKLKAAHDAAVAERWGAKTPASLRSPLRDGDVERPDDPAYAGHYWINVKSDRQPNVVGPDMQPILDPRQFVSGDFCRISVNAYSYAKKGNNGVSFGLNNIQMLRKGEPLTATGRAAESDFDAVANATDFESDDDDVGF